MTGELEGLEVSSDKIRTFSYELFLKGPKNYTKVIVILISMKVHGYFFP